MSSRQALFSEGLRESQAQESLQVLQELQSALDILLFLESSKAQGQGGCRLYRKALGSFL